MHFIFGVFLERFKFVVPHFILIFHVLKQSCLQKMIFSKKFIKHIRFFKVLYLFELPMISGYVFRSQNFVTTKEQRFAFLAFFLLNHSPAPRWWMRSCQKKPRHHQHMARIVHQYSAHSVSLAVRAPQGVADLKRNYMIKTYYFIIIRP